MAEPPPNDTCGDAIAIANTGSYPRLSMPVDITDAGITGDPSTPSCPGFSASSSRSTWYTYTPSESGAYNLTTCSDLAPATTVGDTILAIYTSSGGCGGTFTELPGGCNDDACGPGGRQSRVTVDMTAGTLYYVVVWQWGDSVPPPGAGTVQVAVDLSVAPPNDTCEGAILAELNVPVSGTSVGAANHFEVFDLDCFGGVAQEPVFADGLDVVYRFVAPSAGTYSFKVYNYSVLSDLVVYVASSCPSGAPPALVMNCLGAANHSPFNSAESVDCVVLDSAQEVFVFVDEEGTSGGSSFVLEVTRCVLESEPANGSQETPNLLYSGVTGFIQSFSDVDFYTLGAPPAGARVFALIDGEAANFTDFDLRVVSTNATYEYDHDNNDALYGDSAPNIAGTPLDGESVYLRVTFNGFIVAGPYRLYALVQPPMSEATEEVEPNNSWGTAQTPANLYVLGSLDSPPPGGDVDIYRFSARRGDLIHVGLDGDPLRNDNPLNAQLDLFDEDGTLLVSVNDGADASSTTQVPDSINAFVPNSPAESLICRVTSDGDFFVRVSSGETSPSDTAIGDYLLSISINGYAGPGGTNRPPSIDSIQAQSPIIKGESTALEVLFSDPDLGQAHTLTVDWADGSEPTVTSFVLGENRLALTHVYANPPPGPDGSAYAVNVRLADQDGSVVEAMANVVVYRVQPARFISIEPQEDGTIRMNLQGQPDTSYRLWWSADMIQWQMGDLFTADTEGLFTAVDTTLPQPAVRFYQAVAP